MNWRNHFLSLDNLEKLKKNELSKQKLVQNVFVFRLDFKICKDLWYSYFIIAKLIRFVALQNHNYSCTALNWIWSYYWYYRNIILSSNVPSPFALLFDQRTGKRSRFLLILSLLHKCWIELSSKYRSNLSETVLVFRPSENEIYEIKQLKIYMVCNALIDK